ncbi:McrC family protein [Alkalimarinus alittae]|uniref:McrC family protein n=1 Tax=Alkalimarinus alittae TaxID=2961619 RepID=A0ABY6MXA7_9ALTE|nr:McrC family protein [Alkalimarinus alittae]UZE94440.1 McrC family protein [Alkalimarinus alittae]
MKRDMNKIKGFASNSVTIFEYGYLSADLENAYCAKISAQSFYYLERLALTQDNKTNELLRLCDYQGAKAIKVMNYVGVIQTPFGEHIEILPKIARRLPDANASSTGEALAREALLNMLKHLKHFRHIESSDSQVAALKMPLLEVFIRQFLQSVNQLVKRGLRSDYVRREDNQSFLKGKLLTSKQLKHNLINQHCFYVEYDEYLQDRPINRLIHTALNKVAGLAQLNSHQKLCRELLFAFADIPLSKCIKNDFTSLRLDRGMDYYHTPLAWTRLILEGDSPISMQGKANALSLLFPMEAVFEAYVGSILKSVVRQEYRLEEQRSFRSLVVHEHKKWFKLKPDFLVLNQKDTVLVMDSKWKLLNSSKANGYEKYGLSQADFYQMFAYGHKYLEGQGQLVLIYPVSETFKEPIQASFDYDSNLKLWVVPFDIDPAVKDVDRLKLPDGLDLDVFRDC